MKGRVALNKAKFITTAVLPADYPKLRIPEVAVVGRSNVGKSSLLNDLFQQKSLVKVSCTPGKTQHLNFFNIEDKLSFVDIPGYGYAEVPASVRKQWGPMVQAYLEGRDMLQVILFLFDIRRVPNEEDFQMLDWIAEAGKSMILVLTKVDKVTQNEKAAFTQKILSGFRAANLHYVHYSTLKRTGRPELVKMLFEALQDTHDTP